jgi:hypothetical protein
MTEALNKNCVSLNENDEQIINKNLFLHVFCYNEYVKDAYKTNKLIHYKNIYLKIAVLLLIMKKNRIYLLVKLK